MKRLFRTLLAAIGILALVAVGAVIYVTTFFDPDDLKPRLVEVVREQSGLELALEGPLTWSFYPRLGVGVERAEAWLPEQQIEEDESFLAFRHAEVSLAFAPLLRGEIAIDGLILDGMRLNLERDEDGRGNWESLIERLSERSAEAEEVLAPASAGPHPGGLSVALNIASVQVRGGDVSFRDLGLEQELHLGNVEITGSNVNPSRPFPMRVTYQLTAYDDLNWQENERPSILTGDMALEGRVALGLAERRYVFEGFSLNARGRLAGIEERQRVQLQSRQLVVDASARRLQLENGVLETTLHHETLGDAPLPLSLAFALDADLNEQTAQLRDLELTGEHGLKLNGNLSLSKLLEAPAYSGQLRLSPLSLRPWLDRLGMMPDMASPSALADVALTSSLQGDAEGFVLPGLTLVLDGGTFTGRLAAGLDGRRLDFELQGDRLDLDAYLPAESAGEASALRSLPGMALAYAAEPGALVPADWLEALDLDGQLSVGRLRLMGLDFRDVALELDGGEGVQRLTRFESVLYGGELTASGEIDLTREPIRWQLEPNLSRVRMDSLLEALGEEPAPLRGRLSTEGELTSRGNSWPELKRQLNGRLEAYLEDGAILDINVSQELCTAVAALGDEETSRDWHADTRFEQASAIFELRDGVVHSDDLLIAIPGIELGGRGQLDLSSERFDLRAAARLVDSADAACRVNPRLEQVPFPIRCEGQLGSDSDDWCRFDRDAFQNVMVELLRDEAGRRAGEEVERRIEDALERLDERLGEDAGRELRDALRGLFD